MDDDVAAPTGPVFCNRTLNLRSIRAIGYDLDYTLVHYHVDEWEGAAFAHATTALASRGWPVGGLDFDPAAYTQGLVFDLELGNIVKATRFGYVVRASHGTRPLPFDELRRCYAGTFVDLAEARFAFMNTMFSLSQASLFAQLIDLCDAGALPARAGYLDVWRTLEDALNEAHTQGELKALIRSDPARFVDPDPRLGLALADQFHAGKKLLLVTNSDWGYTQAMAEYTLDPVLPGGLRWRDLFALVIVEAAKPRFFSGRNAVFRLVDEAGGLFEPHRGPLREGEVYLGGDALAVERSLGLAGDQLLYVGDHLFGDVHVSKSVLRWRTALIMRELEGEVAERAAFDADQRRLDELMVRKAVVDDEVAQLRLARQRLRRRYAPAGRSGRGLEEALAEATARSAALDDELGPLAQRAGALSNPAWGPLMRAGSDKSLFARQVERYADVYTSRVSNLGAVTPYAYLRASRTTLPHDAV
ncbi:MAG: HAD-IG family 5'-nucleotidase [Acidimicrobiia bacterium]|nr:HAD-IG family 5'-nucleotidase [Acidimicrobiia bacterium]